MTADFYSPSIMKLIELIRVKDTLHQRIAFELPLNETSSELIQVVVTLIQKYSAELKTKEVSLPLAPKLLLYLEGGPGFASGIGSNTNALKEFISRGYQVVSLDQRGVGYSTPLEASTLLQLDTPDRQLEYVLNFRSDSIVEDCERIRQELIGDSRWSLCGQSYGGFVSLAYVSKYNHHIKEVLLTGGIPPIGLTADEVYKATYERTKERNVHYYKKYPQDIKKVKNILGYLHSNKVTLPNGGYLSVERFQGLGLAFGTMGGTDMIHKLVNKFDYDLELKGKPTYSILSQIETSQSFDTNMIYAFFLEAIYCDGEKPRFRDSVSRSLLEKTPLNNSWVGNRTSGKTNWVGDRLRLAPGNERFVYNADSDVVYFTGEMIFKSIFTDYKELSELKELGDLLHQHNDWSSLYHLNLTSVSWEDVPIVAAVYYHDQYVDFDTSVKVKKDVFGDTNLKLLVTTECFHNGLRTHLERILEGLFGLLDEEFD